jgi:hypothetical protein
MAAKQCTTSSLSLPYHTDRALAGLKINNYTFNWDRMTFFEGHTGPYLQYAHTQLTSLTRKNQNFYRFLCQIKSPPRHQQNNPQRGKSSSCWARTRMWCGQRCARMSRAVSSHSCSNSRMLSRARGRPSSLTARRTLSMCGQALLRHDRYKHVVNLCMAAVESCGGRSMSCSCSTVLVQPLYNSFFFTINKSLAHLPIG